MSWFLCTSGETLFEQINRRWGRRDHASDGSIGDASHQAVPSDHNPCWTCPGDHEGVVRAIDIDADLDSGDPDAIDRLFNQLRILARKGKDGGRLKYLIHDRKIASGTYPDQYWKWRPYTGTDPHTSHGHVSFTERGDFRDGKFRCPIFTNPLTRLRDELRKIRGRIGEHLVPKFRDARRALRQARADAKRIQHRIDEHKES